MMTQSEWDMLTSLMRRVIREELLLDEDDCIETIVRRVIREEMFPNVQPTSADSSLYAAPGMEVR